MGPRCEDCTFHELDSSIATSLYVPVAHTCVCVCALTKWQWVGTSELQCSCVQKQYVSVPAEKSDPCSCNESVGR